MTLGGRPVADRVRGSTAVPLGTVVLGLATYAFLSLTGRVLGPARYSGFAVLWSLVYIIGPGVFQPVEQETARAVAHARAVREPLPPLLRRAAMQAGALVALAVLVLGLAHDQVRDLLLGSGALVAALYVCVLAIAVTHPTRGLLAGLGRQTGYGRSLAIEGLLRLAAAVALVIAGVRSPAAFGLLAGLPMAAGALIAGLLERVRPSPVTGEVPEVTSAPTAAGRRSFVFLLAASLLAQLLITSGPVAASRLAGPGEAEAAGQLLAGLLLARVPLLAVASVQTALLPRLTQLHAAADEAGLRRLLGRLAGIVVGLTAVAVLGAATLGPFVLRLLFGPGFDLGRVDLALLVLGVGGYLVALLVGLGLIARRENGVLASAWAIGVTVAAVVLAIGPGLVRRVELSLVGGAWCSALVVLTAVLLRRRTV